MSVTFTKNQKNNTVACFEGHSFFKAKASKRDPTFIFYTCEMYKINSVSFSFKTFKYFNNLSKVFRVATF